MWLLLFLKQIIEKNCLVIKEMLFIILRLKHRVADNSFKCFFIFWKHFHTEKWINSFFIVWRTMKNILTVLAGPDMIQT
jgi:glycerol-3-phosphate acyltransferase PlsY